MGGESDPIAQIMADLGKSVDIPPPGSREFRSQVWAGILGGLKGEIALVGILVFFLGLGFRSAGVVVVGGLILSLAAYAHHVYQRAMASDKAKADARRADGAAAPQEVLDAEVLGVGPPPGPAQGLGQGDPRWPPAAPTAVCPACWTRLTWVPQFQRWYCPRESRYV